MPFPVITSICSPSTCTNYFDTQTELPFKLFQFVSCYRVDFYTSSALYHFKFATFRPKLNSRIVLEFIRAIELSFFEYSKSNSLR